MYKTLKSVLYEIVKINWENTWKMLRKEGQSQDGSV